jgi:hypothetical protein
MDAATFFGLPNALRQDNPPAAADAAVMGRFAAFGVAPGKSIDLKSMHDDIELVGQQRQLDRCKDRLAFGGLFAWLSRARRSRAFKVHAQCCGRIRRAERRLWHQQPRTRTLQMTTPVTVIDPRALVGRLLE